MARYAAEHTAGPDELAQRLIAETAERLGGASQMQIGARAGRAS